MNRIIPLILAFALFMEQIDSTVISTALPAIASDIGTSPIALKLALTAYLVSLAIFIPLSGWMADRFGAKRIFIAAISVFMVGSLACAAANSLLWFVFARFLQGMGGAMMSPVARLVLVRTTAKSELIGAMAWLTIPALVGPLIGPPLGGFITTYFTWHWIFLINIPIGIAGIIATLLFLPSLQTYNAGPFDLRGLILTGVAAAGIVFGLSVISLPALPPSVGMSAIAIGVLSAIAYVYYAKHSPAPVLRLSILANPVLRATIIGGSLFRIGIGAMPFLMPLMLQLGFGLNPFQSGMITFVGALGALSMKFAAQSTFARYGFRNVLLTMSILSSLSIVAIGGFSPGVPFAVLYFLLLAGGFTRSLFFTGLNALAFSEVDSADISHASALSVVSQQLSIALGVALAGGLLEASTFVTGTTLSVGDFQIAFVVIGIVTAFGVLPFITMRSDTGIAVSGHVPKLPPLP